ncbi:hypothetical protein FB107DRAFT_255364 [Schizophyllum commune]
MIVLEGVPLTPGAALDPLDPHFKPNPDRATPILDRPLLVPLDTPHVPSHLKASTSTSQLASSSHSDPAPYTLRLITYGFERGRPDITPALTFDIRDLPNPPKPVREAHLGTSEVMQEWFFADDGVRLRFKEVLHEVLDAVGRFYEEHRDEERSDDDRAHDNEAARHTLTIAVCCRKGKHRSVAFVERLARELRKALAHDVWRVEVSHRDVHLPKSRPSTAVPPGMSALTSDTAQLSDETSSASASVASSVMEVSKVNGETNGVASLEASEVHSVTTDEGDISPTKESEASPTEGMSEADGWK